MHTATVFLLAASAVLLAPAASAQHVWIVDDTAATSPDFTDLQTAISTVASGDVLLLKTGVYPRMIVMGKSLTIAAYPGESPVVDARTTNVADRIRVLSLHSAGTFRLQGVELRETGDASWPALELRLCQGTVWIEDCRVLGEFVSPGVSVTGCSSVALLGVTAIGGQGENCGDFFTRGPGPGLDVVSNSSVHCYGCTFQGTDGNEDDSCIPSILGVCGTGRKGGTGLRSQDSANFLMLSGCTITGGRSACHRFVCDYPPSPQEGGIGLEATSGTVHALDCALQGGQGSLGSPFSPCIGPQGPAFTGTVQFLPGRALRVTPLHPTHENGVAALHIEGPPHSLVRMGTSDRPGTLPEIALLRGTLLLAPSPAPLVRNLGITNAAGLLDSSIALGPFPPGVEAQISFHQVYYLQPEIPFARRVGQPLDDFVLGQATMLVGLDESF